MGCRICIVHPLTENLVKCSVCPEELCPRHIGNHFKKHQDDAAMFKTAKSILRRQKQEVVDARLL